MLQRAKVVIIGAGFGGLNAAKALRHAPVDVLLIDANNFHTFQPLLYQVATAALDAGDVAHQVRQVFARQRNFRFRLGRVVAVDSRARELTLAGGAVIDYDYLIVAAGAVYSDFAVPGVRDNAFVLKSLERSTALRSHILERFEKAAVDRSAVERGALTFVVVGAGPTGVEMSGALSELFTRVLPADYPELDLRLARVVLIEGANEVLPTFGARSRRYAERTLRGRGVDVRLSSTVAAVSDRAVTLRSGEVIPCETVVWAAGVTAHPLANALGAPQGRGGRIVVMDDLSLEDHSEVFVVGDMAASTDAAGALLPQVAQVAIQGGKHAAKTIVRRIQGRAPEPFTYRDLGSMAIVGRSSGIAELSPALGGLRLRGFIGWLGWLFLHLIYLPGYRNRLSAFMSWAYNFFTFDRHARLILTGAATRAADPGWSASSRESTPSQAPSAAVGTVAHAEEETDREAALVRR